MTTTIIEVNGVKLEVDLRSAKRVDELRVGDRVKVLTKVYDGHKVYAGSVIGFEPFNALPTIIVAYVEQGYNATDIKFVHYNAGTKDVEIIKAIDDDALDIAKDNILSSMEREIEKKRREIADIEEKRAYFLRNFQAYWQPVSASAEED